MLALDMPFLADFRISDNQIETAEGYLICMNVPVARLGTQDYLAEEMGLQGRYGQVVKVHRLPEEVFSKKALSSLEGKPVTDDHPSSGVNASNWGTYAKGHVQNVRQDGDFVVADLVIKDPVLISKVKNGKRQVSCGYNCAYVPYGKDYKQTDIHMNHVAVVAAGRAGPRVAIKDQLPIKKGVSKIMNRQQAFAEMFSAYAKDATPEQIAAMLPFVTVDAAQQPDAKTSEVGLLAKLMTMIAKDKKAKDEDPDEEEKAESKEKEEAKDAKTLDKRLSAIEATLSQLAADKKAKDEDEEEDIELAKKLLENEEKEAAEDESMEEQAAMDEDESEAEEEKKKDAKDAAMADLMRSLKPALATLKAADQKKIKQALKGSTATSNAYSEIRKGVLKAKDHAAANHADLGMKIAEQFNPHYQTNK